MSVRGKILVVDDEESLRILLSKELGRAGFMVDTVPDGSEVLKRVREESYQVILLDILMPQKNGVEVLSAVKRENISAEVIILTGNATVESAIECMKLGAFEYVKKPYTIDELIIKIDRAIEHFRLQNDMKVLKRDLSKTTGYGGKIIGRSKEIKELRKIISRVAPTQSTVLVLGESGSGKELVSRAIHDESGNRERPFVAINCASLSETLLESELFGYEKGAFTDAKVQKRGLAEIADGGTLFLDEIGEIPIRFQAKLLRFLETGEIRRVGGTRDISLNVRILCATNKPLEKLVAQGEFREDLYYRLNVLSVTVPSLREHKEDIPLLVEHIVSSQGYTNEFEKKAIAILCEYDWPGNVRELKNVIERSCVLCNGSIVTAQDLSFLHKTSQPADFARQDEAADSQAAIQIKSLREMERHHIITVLKFVHGHKREAAKLLQINPKTLYYKMRQYNIVTDFK